MDSALKNPTGRKYPAYTTADLKKTIAETNEERAARYLSPLSDEKRADIAEEIARRESGASKTMHQILNGK